MTNSEAHAKNGRGLHRIKDLKKLSKCIQPKLAYQTIRKHNHQIAEILFSGFGVTLMKYDSDLCAMILDRAMNHKIHILPVYDSFIVMEDQNEWLRSTMIDSYHNKIGRLPHIV